MALISARWSDLVSPRDADPYLLVHLQGQLKLFGADPRHSRSWSVDASQFTAATRLAPCRELYRVLSRLYKGTLRPMPL